MATCEHQVIGKVITLFFVVVKNGLFPTNRSSYFTVLVLAHLTATPEVYIKYFDLFLEVICPF